MTLTGEAERAIDVADALVAFREPVADHAAEIAKTIAELTTLSQVLHRVDEARRISDGRTIAQIQEDLDLVQASISYTLSDVWRILGTTGGGATHPSPSSYRKTWKEICHYCRVHDRHSLSSRIRTYHLFLAAIGATLKKSTID